MQAAAGGPTVRRGRADRVRPAGVSPTTAAATARCGRVSKAGAKGTPARPCRPQASASIAQASHSESGPCIQSRPPPTVHSAVPKVIVRAATKAVRA